MEHVRLQWSLRPPEATPRPAPALALTHVVHNGGLGCLAIQVHDSVDARGHVPGCRALSHPVDKEVQSPILPPHHAHRVPCLGRRGAGVRSQAEFRGGLVRRQPRLPHSLRAAPRRCPHSPTLRRSRLCPYSSKMVVPLCITPFPVIIHVPRATRSGRGHEREPGLHYAAQQSPCLSSRLLAQPALCEVSSLPRAGQEKCTSLYPTGPVHMAALRP